MKSSSCWRRVYRTIGVLLCLGALLLPSARVEAAGRWVIHMEIQTAPAGAVGAPIDEFPLPDTTGHWVWVVWFDQAVGRWDFDPQSPYVFSNGTVEFRAPQRNAWYFVYFYDTVTGVYH